MSKVYTASPGNPANIKITAKRNDTFSYIIVGYARDGTPYNFTGHTFIMQVKENSTDTVAIVDITDDSFTIGQNAMGLAASVNNVMTISHTEDDFNISAKCYVYDIQMTDASSVVQTIQEGVFEVTQDVSE